MSKDSQPVDVPQLDGATIVLTELSANGADEYVVIENLGTIAQPLTNWVLASLRGERFYTLPDGLILHPGGKLRIHSGPAAESHKPTDLLWTRDEVWNNKGDTAVLFGANGHEVTRIGNGNRSESSKGAKLLYRDGDEMRIEEHRPYKEDNRGWADPEDDTI